MYLRGALGAALLAVPLAGVAGQSASQHDPPASSAGDSSRGHRFAWVVGGATAGAAVFTTFVRLSERGADADAERGLTLPSSPVPNHYTDGSLPGSGVSPGQNAPPPGQTPSPGQSSSTGDDQNAGPGPIVLDTPTNDSPSNDSAVTPPTNPPGDGHTEQQQPPPQYKPPSLGAIAVTTPEPESIFLLGTGLIPLVPTLRRRRSSRR